MSYTVKELIETLKQCPQDYPVEIASNGFFYGGIESVGIDNEGETVDLFFNDGSEQA